MDTEDVSLGGGTVEGRPEGGVAGVHIGSRLQQHQHHLRVTLKTRQVQWLIGLLILVGDEELVPMHQLSHHSGEDDM